MKFGDVFDCKCEKRNKKVEKRNFETAIIDDN
jgi:hypothetical protein